MWVWSFNLKLKKQEKKLQSQIQRNLNETNKEIQKKNKKNDVDEAIERKKLMDLITEETLNETDYYFENGRLM